MKLRNSLLKTIDKLITNRVWSEQDIIKYAGESENSYKAYSTDELIRSEAASGGVVSAILIYLLRENIISGALVCKTEITSDKVRARFFIATTEQEILQARGSKYVSAGFSRDAVPLISEFKGKLAVVGLPCEITLLQKIISNDIDLNNKIVLKIGLLCGHASTPQLIDGITAKLNKQAGSDLVDYKFRIGNWRGKLRATYKNGQIIEKGTGYFNNYQNLYFFAEKKCFFCNDHFAYNSDVSVGDIWSYSLKDEPVKYSGIITRNKNSDKIISQMLNNSVLAGSEIDVAEILNGQSRGIRLHYNLSAKREVGKLFGLKIPDNVKERTKWFEYLVVYIAMFNWNWSKGRNSSLIFKIPKILLKLYLYFMKGLQSLK